MSVSYRQKYHWGTHLWGFIHTITIIDFENNKEQNEKARDILLSLEDCFPCYKCKSHYKDFLVKLEQLDMTQSLVLFYWSVDLHNLINKKYCKSEWSYDQALDYWANKVDYR